VAAYEAGDAVTADEWIVLPRGTFVGVSSATIWSALTGRPMPFGWHPDIPYDPDDFSRCFKLLNLIPQWRSQLDEVARQYPAWRPFVAAWDDLEGLYVEGDALPYGGMPHQRLYEKILEIRGVDRKLVFPSEP
jgi:hypothetical protein